MIRLLRPIQYLDLTTTLRRLFLPVCLFLFCLFSTQFASAQVVVGNDSELLQQYNAQALKLMNEYRYEESLEVLYKAVKLRENPVSYYYITHIQTLRNEWEDAVKNGERAIQIDSNITPVYPDLFYAYTKVGKWKDAQRIADKARKGDPKGYLAGEINLIDSEVDTANRSTVVVCLLLMILGAVFFIPFYRSSKDPSYKLPDEDSIRFSEVLLVSASVSSILYAVFYACSHWIWSQNQHVPLPDFAVMMRMATLEHDGVESFVMYVMVTANIVITLMATAGLLKLKKNKNIYLPVCVVLLLLSCYYFFKTGFFPPEESVDTQYIFLPFLLAALSAGLFILYKYNSTLSKIIVVGLIAYTGLVPLAPPSLVDFDFIFSPGLRFYHGFKVAEVYSQYDLFLSFLAYAWMKLNLAIEWFPYIGTFAFFLFFLASFFFSDRFFKTKGLSVIFIIALILARLYLISHDTQLTLQVTPIRLDLWIILLLVAVYRDIRHWLLGIFLGLLVLFHRNLGLIYLTAYMELLVVLFLIDLVSLAIEKSFSFKSLSDLVIKHLRLNAKNLAIILASIALCFILFKEMFSASAIAYRKIGINFLPVYKQSFYWYFPVVLGCLFVFLLYLRKRLGEKYTATGLFLVLLAIANSMYFYGRSHENNVLNLTGILILTLFALLDVLIFQAPQQPVKTAASVPQKSQHKGAQPRPAMPKSAGGKKSFLSERNVYLSLSVLVVFLMGYYYSERIDNKLKTQYNNLVESNFAFPFPLSFMDTAAVRQITHNSSKVYFMDDRYDFYYYYFGKYEPQGYYSPFCAYVYKKDIIDFVQSELDKGYYVIYDAQTQNDYAEYLPYLKYNQSYQKNNIIALKKEDVPLLLSNDPSQLWHIAMKDTLASPGIDYSGLEIKGDFSLEVIVKPGGIQVNNAGILNNLSQLPGEGLRGMAFQLNNNLQNQYIVAFSNGTPAIPNVAFNMQPDVWHYIAVTVNKDFLKVYDNGKLVATTAFGGRPFVNSELALTVGNRVSRDCHFKGFIKEVKFSSGNISEADIISTGQKLSAGLNGQAAAN